MQMPMSDRMKEALTDVDYPASKGEIMSSAKTKNLSDQEIGMVQKLPEREYSTMSEVTDELSKVSGAAM
jgi:hypothetical protein